jgi:hypothetical protein
VRVFAGQNGIKCIIPQTDTLPLASVD